MKTCPVCQAKAFDDATICYGCLHRFEDEEIVNVSTRVKEIPSQPEFLIRFVPVMEPTGATTWSCKVEVPACREIGD